MLPLTNYRFVRDILRSLFGIIKTFFGSRIIIEYIQEQLMLESPLGDSLIDPIIKTLRQYPPSMGVIDQVYSTIDRNYPHELPDLKNSFI